MVGCATGSAIDACHGELIAPLAAAGYDLALTFYFGEPVLRADDRGRGHDFSGARKAHAKTRDYARACFCAAERAVDHTRRPAGYSPLNRFWGKRG